MFARKRVLLLWALAIFSAGWAIAAGGDKDSFDNVERVVAIGDIHGDFERLVSLLRTAKLIDNNNGWIGAKSHLVLTGDFLDRGPESRKVMDLLIELGPQAEAAGGRIHPLIGNHEAMNVYGDLRYVSKGDYDSYRAPNSADLRNKAMSAALNDARRNGQAPESDAAFRKTFQDEHPLGWVEQRSLFSANGTYGKWLRKQNAVIRINDSLYLHGGISPKYASMSREEMNRRIREELDDFSKIPKGIASDPDGPLWYRGLAELPENDPTMPAHLERVLSAQQVRHIVISHTPQLAILPRFGGKVIVIDVGLSNFYGGPPAFLLFENPKYYAVHRGRQLDLPVTAAGSVIQYLREAATLDPVDSRLRKAVK
jgi:calcineurin-like phosphoesterase family protein